MNEILKKLSLLRASNGIDSKKYCVIVHLEESPVSIQKRMRDE